MGLREQTSVTFRVVSAALTAADISTRTGLAADNSWKMGDQRGRFGSIEKKNGFELESKLPVNASLDEHMKAMLRRLAPAAQKIGSLAGESSVEFVCTVHRKVAPMLRFERDDLRWLGVMGARLDVDIFVLRDDDSAHRPPRTETPTAPPATGPGFEG